MVCLVLLLAVLGTILPLPLRGAGRRFGRVFAAEDLAVLKSYAKEVSYERAGLGKGNWTNDFILQRGGSDYHGFCVNPNKSTPGIGTSFRVSEQRDEQVRKVLYYGYGSRANAMGELGLSSEEQLVISHVTLARAMGDPHWSVDLNARGKEQAERYWKLVKSRPAPKENLLRAFLCHNKEAEGQDLLYFWQAPKEEEVPRTSFVIRKRSAADPLTKKNRCYSLAGVCYGLYDDATCRKQLQEICLTREGESQRYEGTFQNLTPGKQYFVRESKGPANGSYRTDERVYSFTAKAGGNVHEIGSMELKDEPVYDVPDILWRKKDAQLSEKGQGDGSLFGAEYSIRFYPEDLPSAEAAKDKKAAYCWLMRTDEKGEIHFQDPRCYVSGDPLLEYQGKKVLPLGSYLIQEKRAPRDAKGRAIYALDPKLYLLKTVCGSDHQVKTVHPLIDGQREQILRGGILLEKRETSYPDGRDYTAAMSLEGIRFSIYNRSAKTVAVDLNRDGIYSEDERFAPGAKIREIICKKYSQEEAMRLYGLKSEAKEVYLATTDDDGDGYDRSLPYGKYGIVEETMKTGGEFRLVNQDYCLGERQEKTVEISRDLQEGKLCQTDIDGKKLTFAENNRPIRSDLLLRKIKEDSKEKIQVPFLLIREETGEKHIVMTGADGSFDSRAGHIAHSHKTNANDRFLDRIQLDQGSKETKSGEWQIKQDKPLTVSEMTEDAGTWFGLGRYGNMARIDDQLGALPKGHYRLMELSCDKNRGYELVNLRFAIGQDPNRPGEIADLGTVSDRPIKPEIPRTEGKVHAPGLGDLGQLWIFLICGTFALGSMAVLLAIRGRK